MDRLDAAFWVALAVVALVAFHDAPSKLARSRRQGWLTRDRSYHLANAASIVLFAAWLVAVLWPGLDRGVLPVAGTAATAARAAALAVALAGCALSIWARLALDDAFVPTSAVRADQRVVRRGPYARVRRPFYLGLLATMAGGVVALDSAATLVAFALLVPLVVVLAKKEEEHLAGALGEAYRAYADEVPRWWPRRY